MSKNQTPIDVCDIVFCAGALVGGLILVLGIVFTAYVVWGM